MVPSKSLALMLLAIAGAASAASAQGFMLFGDKNVLPEGDQQFVMPITSPFYNENSLVTTDVRLVFAHHRFNDDSILGDDAWANVVGVQARLAFTETLQLVAFKDGYIDLEGDVVDTEGFNDIGAGLKWQFWRDVESNFYAAAGAGYEFSFGQARALQDDSEARVWLSVDKGFGKLHFGGTLNGRFSTSDDDRDNGNSNVLTWHLRADYRLTEKFSPVIEINGYHIINDSDTGVPLNGADVLNFGATDADPTISGGVGVEYRFTPTVAVRGAFEAPLSDNDESLFGTRYTFSVVISF